MYVIILLKDNVDDNSHRLIWEQIISVNVLRIQIVHQIIQDDK